MTLSLVPRSPPLPPFCPVAPGAPVQVYELVGAEQPWPAWLCPAAARRIGSGERWNGIKFIVRSRRTPPHPDLSCDFHRALGEECGT